MSHYVAGNSDALRKRLAELSIRPVVGDKFRPMTDAEIDAIESLVLGHLHEPYRTFLRIFGASSFTKLLVFRPTRPLPPEISRSGNGHLDAFYGIEESERTAYSLEARIQHYSGRMPKNIMPIADNGGGNQICLGISGTEEGRIFYWDHEREPLEEEDYQEDYGKPRPPGHEWTNVHPIADSFDDLLNRLQPDEIE